MAWADGWVGGGDGGGRGGRRGAGARSVPAGWLDGGQVVFQEAFDRKDMAGVVGPQSQPAGLSGVGHKPGAALWLDAKRLRASVAAAFEVPTDDPAYIVFEAAATRPGRLVVHFQPAEVPAGLKDKVQKEDWADPERQYDMRALVELQRGEWKTYTIDLNRGVFEAITKDKKVYDLAGLKIKAIGFEVNQPGEAGQQVLVGSVRVIGLNGVGRHRYLQAAMEQVRSPLEGMGASSAVAGYWRRIVSEMNMQVIGFDLGLPVAEWRDLVGRIETLMQASRKWGLASGGKAAYLVGTETSLRRVSGRNDLYAFAGSTGANVQAGGGG